MLIDLIATIAAGFLGAGVALLLGQLFRGRWPRWMLPALTAAAMFGYVIYSEYSWYGQTLSALPRSTVVLEAPETRSPFRPWTYVFPLRQRMIAIDPNAVRLHEARPDYRLGTLLFLARHGHRSAVPVLVDCANGLRLELTDGVELQSDGSVRGGDWRKADDDDPLLPALCV